MSTVNCKISAQTIQTGIPVREAVPSAVCDPEQQQVPDWESVGKTLGPENPCSYVTGPSERSSRSVSGSALQWVASFLGGSLHVLSETLLTCTDSQRFKSSLRQAFPPQNPCTVIFGLPISTLSLHLCPSIFCLSLSASRLGTKEC